MAASVGSVAMIWRRLSKLIGDSVLDVVKSGERGGGCKTGQGGTST